MRSWVASLALLFACITPASAQEAENVEASAGDLNIIHLWTTDLDGFLKAWAGPTPPRLPTNSSVERNEQITQMILFVNCTKDKAGYCYLSATVDITAPDGTPYGEQMAFDAVKRKVDLERNIIGLADGGIGLTIEDDEQLGRYRIELNVTDEISGLTATSIVFLEAVEEGGLE